MNQSEHAIGIEFISVLGLPPVEFVSLAAELGCRHIGIGLEPIASAGQYPPWSMRDDAGLRREMAAALRDHDVAISIGEGFLVRPGKDVSDTARDLDLMRELGVPRVNILSLDADQGRSISQLASFVDLAAERGMTATLEFLPGMPGGDLPAALATARAVARPEFSVLIDAMHLFRSGGTAADVAATDPALIGYAQLCDVPLVSRHASYADEARYDRLPPGEGELPLLELLRALPPGIPIGLELPMRERALAGATPHDLLAGAVPASRDLLCQI